MARRGINRILAASDGDAASEHAVEVARTIAQRIGVKLEVLSVDTAGLPELAVMGNRLQRNGSSGDVRWESGLPGFEIVHRAERVGADLVVLGREPRGRQHPLALGRTSDTVIRRRDGPCLLIPPSVTGLQRIVLALDGTRRGLGILDVAAALTSALKADPIAVHVCNCNPLTTALDGCLDDPAVQRIREAMAGYPELGGGEGLRIKRGVPVAEILDALEEHQADLLVLGVRRGGPPGEMGSGHIGQDLLRTSPTAILTVPI